MVGQLLRSLAEAEEQVLNITSLSSLSGRKTFHAACMHSVTANYHSSLPLHICPALLPHMDCLSSWQEDRSQSLVVYAQSQHAALFDH